ncbi:Hypothetical Protein FCC1311_016822 [Hondaea fermentalgiana]|uniref:Uncharacterized protein n=1 Tax=Hondaea fermentalgiana TaxID=2315210 RepID=A0A2R5GCI0_9STRA|nr:Hypothetical Protein FCC1311_016822 [Hondaea fermentalgiana]|eukprot:GBG25464.1 Hypothetical Protein FCC1311_016822 [Hondaea fermentalgiana]
MEDLMNQFLQEKKRKQTTRAKAQIRASKTTVQRRAAAAQTKLRDFEEKHGKDDESSTRAQSSGKNPEPDDADLDEVEAALLKVQGLDKRVQAITDSMNALMKESRQTQARVNAIVPSCDQENGRDDDDDEDNEVQTAEVLQLALRAFGPTSAFVLTQ